MPRITQKNLDTLAENITKYLDNGHTYTAGRHFGLRWTFVRDGGNTVLNAATKSELYDLMHAFFSGAQHQFIAQTVNDALNQTKGA